MNKRKVLLVGALGAVSSFAGCTELTHLGVSGQLNAVGSEQSPLAAPRYFTTIQTPEGRRLAPVIALGDADGDGLDDFILGAVGPDSATPGMVADMKAYLFYGRAQLPEEMSYADADATFDTGYMESMPLGDINGDGLADFALGDGTGLELVFGSPQRYSGEHPKFSAGLKWTYGEPPNGRGLALRFFRAYSVGDVNGDGASEFVVQAAMASSAPVGWSIEHYLFEGRTSDWPSGTWDPSWASAKFGVDDPLQQLPYPTSSGDIDGDGYSDVIAFRDEQSWLYYGGPRGLHGTLTETVADAELGPGTSIVGDIDGDGADDLSVGFSGESKFVYGSSARYSGVVTPQADLLFAERSGSISIGDFNADGLTDMLVTAGVVTEPNGAEPAPPAATYELRGTGTRLTGRKVLQQSELYRPVGYAAPEALNTAAGGSIGDIDGDGSTDLLGIATDEAGVASAVYILPGNGPTPD
jgi:hypothetical protein